MQFILYQSFIDMSLKKYRLPKRIGSVELVKQTLYLTAQFKETERIYRERLDAINKLYTDRWCPRKVDDIIDLPPGVKEGYTHFRVIDRFPVITRDQDSQYPQGYTISWDFIGEFTGPDVAPFTAHLKTTKPAHDTTQSPQA